MIFPKGAPPLVSIVEVKTAKNSESHAQVVGQLLKFYARALRTGVDGLKMLVEALERTKTPRHDAMSPALIWCVAEADADARLLSGRPLAPQEIALHIVVDEPTTALRRRLLPICEALEHHHRLPIAVWRIDESDGVPCRLAPVHRRVDARGRAFAGSQRQIQSYVNERTLELEASIRAAAKDLRSPEVRIDWVSPLEADCYREYWDSQALRILGRSDLADSLARFWPAGGPRWDALAKVETDGVPGVILLEAKSYPGEMRSAGAKATGESLERIKASLAMTKRWRGVPQDTDWLGALYQSANRLAHLHFFRQVAGVPAWLVNVYFLNDPAAKRRTSRQRWEVELRKNKRELGCDGLEMPYTCDVFLPPV